MKRWLPPVLIIALMTGGAQAKAPPDMDLGGSAFGLFLVGQTALNLSEPEQASRYFEAADKRLPGSDIIRNQRFLAAVMSGDISLAARLAPPETSADSPLHRLGQLVVAVEAIATGDGHRAREMLSERSVSFPHRSAAALLWPWAAAVSGDQAASFTRPSLDKDRLVELFGQLGQAQLYERAGRFDEAETDYKALTSWGRKSGLFSLEYGQFLERRGRASAALAEYDAALLSAPVDRELVAARKRILNKRAPPKLASLRAGAANALLAPATLMAGDGQAQMAVIYSRLALRLDPTRADAQILLGDTLLGIKDYEGARRAYRSVRQGADRFPDAAAKLAWTYQSAGESAAAMQLARAASENAPEDLLTAAVFSDILRANDRHADAVAVLDRIQAADPRPDWRRLFGRGVSLERLGRWPEAERDLLAALKLAPDEPDILNYLGYSWIDRGERVDEGLRYVQKALAANPNSGSFTDSLGWAYFRLGKFTEAVTVLEQAVLLDAGQPEINDHLGDAYWRVGRRDEAQFQWKRVLTLEPDAKLKGQVEAKLATGLAAIENPVADPKKSL